MRVLWLTPNKPEDISVGRERIASHLRARGFDIVLRTADRTVLGDILHADGPYDVVIGTTRAGAIAAVGVAKSTGVPLVVDHVDPIRQLEETMTWPVVCAVRHCEHFAFHQSAHTLYVYPEERERVRRYAPSATETDLGVEYDRFANPHPRVVQAAEDRLDRLELEDNVAIYVGGLEPIYHIRELVAGVDHLDDWSLVVLGSGSLEDIVTDAAATSSSIAYLGTVSHDRVPGYLHAADVGVSLVDDPHTLKVLEYGAARLPTVQLSGRAEEKFAGVVEFCNADPVSIADAIERANDAEDTVDGLQGLAREYSWERIAGEYATVLESVTESEREERRKVSP